MPSLSERSKKRRSIVTVKKVDLHSPEHHSFHPEFDTKTAWELLARLSREAWKEQTGEEAPERVDKSVVRLRKGS